MTDRGREPQVLDAVVSLIDSLLDDFDVVELLTDLTEQCARLLDVASAGLLLAGPGDRLHLLAATSGRTHDLEVLQLQADEGPCLDCYRTGQPVSVADLDDVAARWPRFVAAATENGFASVHAVPMRAAGVAVGALGLFGVRVGELDPADLVVAQTLAHVAAVAILQERAPTADAVPPRLQRALNAQQLLRSHARAHDQHLSRVCQTLMTDPEERNAVIQALETSMPAADA